MSLCAPPPRLFARPHGFARVAPALALLMGGAAASAQNAPANTHLPASVSAILAREGVPHDAVSMLVVALPNATNTTNTRSGTSPDASAIPIVATTPAAAPTSALPLPRLTHRAQAPMNPASVMKLFTTYAGLDMLGEGFTWTNRVYIDGALSNGVLTGNLVLRGSGDPKLVLERIEDLFKQVQAKGVREIRGDIILDREVFNVPDKNPADFDDEPLRPYNAAPDGLLVNFKSLIFTFSPDAANGTVAVKTEPPIAGVTLPDQVLASGGNCGDWRGGLRADFSNPLQVAFNGRYAIHCGERVWPVAYVQPRAYAARVMQAMWRSSGGALSGSAREGKTPPGARLLLAAPSLPLAYIAADINKFSNNVMAQQLFLTLSSHVRGKGSFDASRSVWQAWWRERFGPSGLAAPVIENGSGLSRRERSSAASLSALLARAAQSGSPSGQAFIESLSVAGVDGYVARMRGAAAMGNAQLKTGTLRDVTAIAGYASGQSGQRYSLVAIINHPNANAARPALDALVDWVVRDQ